MKICFQNWVLLLASAFLHVAALLCVAATLTESEIGKNIPVLVYPVRVHVVEAHLAQTNALSPALQGKSSTNLLPPSAAPAASVGRLERSERIYIESSTRYFTPAELDNRPAVLTVPDLELKNIGPMIEGEASLRLFIDERGAVDRMDIEQSTLPDAMLEQLQSQRDRLRFTPGSKNGLDVKSVISYKIELTKEPTIAIVHRLDGLSR